MGWRDSASACRRPRPAASLRSLRAALENASRFLSSAPWRVRIPPLGGVGSIFLTRGALGRCGTEGFRVRLPAAAPRCVASLLACCAGKRFAFPQLRTLAGSNPSAWRRWLDFLNARSSRSMWDGGIPRPPAGGRAPLRRFAPCVLRWKTLRVSSAPHPGGFESLRLAALARFS